MWSYKTPSKSRAERVKKAKVIRWESLDVYWVGRWVLRQRSQYLMCWALLKIEGFEADIAFNSQGTATFCLQGEGSTGALSISVKRNPLMPHAPPDLRRKISLRERRFIFSLSFRHRRHYTEFLFNMAIISASTIVRSVSVSQLVIAYYLLTSPSTISDQNLVFILGAAMDLVCPRPF